MHAPPSLPVGAWLAGLVYQITGPAPSLTQHILAVPVQECQKEAVIPLEMALEFDPSDKDSLGQKAVMGPWSSIGKAINFIHLDPGKIHFSFWTGMKNRTMKNEGFISPTFNPTFSPTCSSSKLFDGFRLAFGFQRPPGH